MKKLFWIMCCVGLLSWSPVFAQAPIRPLTEKLVVPTGTTVTDSIQYDKYSILGYFSTFVIVRRHTTADDGAFGAADSVTFNYTTMDKLPIWTVNSISYGPWWTDQNDYTEIYNAQVLTGLEGVPLDKKTLTPKVGNGLKYQFTYKGDTGDSVDVLIVFEIH